MLKFLRKTALWILLTPAALIYSGAASNQLVLAANHDSFPVMVNDFKSEIMVAKMKAEWKEDTAEAGLDIKLPAGMIDETHCIMTSKTHLNFLADVFDLKDGIYSIGDFGIMLGSLLWAYAPFIWAFEVIRRLHKQD